MIVNLEKSKSPGSSNLDDLLTADFESNLELIEAAPMFFKKLIASFVELDYDSNEDLNSTLIAERFAMVSKADFSYSTQPAPSFSQADINRQIKQLEEEGAETMESYQALANGNTTKLAEYALLFDYYVGSKFDSTDAVMEAQGTPG